MRASTCEEDTREPLVESANWLTELVNLTFRGDMTLLVELTWLADMTVPGEMACRAGGHGRTSRDGAAHRSKDPGVATRWTRSRHVW